MIQFSSGPIVHVCAVFHTRRWDYLGLPTPSSSFISAIDSTSLLDTYHQTLWAFLSPSLHLPPTPGTAHLPPGSTHFLPKLGQLLGYMTSGCLYVWLVTFCLQLFN